MKKLVEHWEGLMGPWWSPHLQWLLSGMIRGELALCSSAVRYAMLVKGNSAGDEIQRSYCRPFVAGCLTQGASYLLSPDGQYVASFQASCSSTAQTQHSFLCETAMPTPYPLEELKRRWDLLLSQGKIQVTVASCCSASATLPEFERHVQQVTLYSRARRCSSNEAESRACTTYLADDRVQS